MATSGLTDEHWHKLRNFKGYGDPSGRFWFIGIEERGEGTPEELAVRLKYRDIEDLLYSQSPAVWGHSPLWEDFDPTKLIPTWTTMIKIVLRLNGHPAWADRDAVREYQKQEFGKLHGDTFLTELLPLPKRSDGDFPSWWPWSSWDEYAEEVLPRRVEMIRTLFEAHRPRFVFCYGKGYWQLHQKLFPEINFTPILAGKMQIAELGSSTIVLTPFFAWFLMTNKLIDKMAKKVERSH